MLRVISIFFFRGVRPRSDRIVGAESMRVSPITRVELQVNPSSDLEGIPNGGASVRDFSRRSRQAVQPRFTSEAGNEARWKGDDPGPGGLRCRVNRASKSRIRACQISRVWQAQ